MSLCVRRHVSAWHCSQLISRFSPQPASLCISRSSASSLLLPLMHSPPHTFFLYFFSLQSITVIIRELPHLSSMSPDINMNFMLITGSLFFSLSSSVIAAVTIVLSGRSSTASWEHWEYTRAPLSGREHSAPLRPHSPFPELCFASCFHARLTLHTPTHPFPPL